MIFAALALAATILAGPANARVDAIAVPSSAKAVRTGGELSDEFWQTVTPVDAFVQRDPVEGGVPSQRTEFRVAYDASTLFVKVRAFDTEPNRIVSYLTRRDGDSPSDWIRVLIDSYHDKRTAYEFAVNPAGVKFDRYWFNDNNSDDSWDAVWDVKVSRDADGWTAEFRIPFSQVRFNPSESITFGFAVSRQIGRLNQTSTWPLLCAQRHRLRVVVRRARRPVDGRRRRSGSSWCRTRWRTSRGSGPAAIRCCLRQRPTERSASISGTR